MRPCFAQRFHSGKDRTASRRRVFHGKHSTSSNIRSFDSTLKTMLLLALSDDERINFAPLGSRSMQHRGCDWVSAKGQTAHSVVIQAAR
ncbi:hypothetical protein GALL_478340 [mine drainage metagenome]|uniref:Uncharacterized protein n=1 Tax=mine drainage metagenome TaxID=410659 RepID=A0A1J5PIE4_9ZZZZ